MNIRKTAFSSFILFALSFAVSAQKNKGDVYYAHYDYRDAIQYYLKAVASNPKDSASLSHLAKCYGVVRDYDNAELYYAKAAAIPGISPSVLYNYAEILKNNGKIDEARAQFAEYSVMVPSDTNAKVEIRYCDHLKQKFYVAYQVSMLQGLNSGFSDFAPVIYNDNLVFVSDRGADMVNFEKSSATGSNFYKMYMAKPLSKGFDKPELFSKTVNGSQSDNNVGPVSFSADGKILFFTKVAAIRKKNFINQVKIYYCESNGSGWSTPQPFPFNSDTYSNMDPAISPDGQQLFFSSNMPGGFGGTDIYVSQKTATGWSQPQNLGSEVNTPGNEAFPYMRKDGTLFFASDRHFNYGGLDMFSSVLKGGKWTNVENLGPDINSTTDDFGICFNSNGHTGYFSSNRKGGSGKDDIYSFLYIGNYSPLKGIVLFSYNINDPAAMVGVKLLDDSGKVISTSQTDKNGAFTFSQLQPDKKYMVQVDEADPRFAGKKKFYLADSTGKIVGVSILNYTKKGKYLFTALPADITSLPKIDASDKNINLAGNLLRGDSSKPIANAKVNLLNADGEVIATTTTNAFGSFVFTNLPPDEPYSFQVVTGPGDDSKLPPNTKVVLTDKNGNTVKTYIVSPDGKFHFEILAGDTASIAH
ncbi:MAG TPA: carboxypeptidase regulatory-like domain-containing protein, partial [Bacteroidia bacterium]|nr:carboxypeptidase regulatory-like domain-containing protein [Bacteroidia bacterium]